MVNYEMLSIGENNLKSIQIPTFQNEIKIHCILSVWEIFFESTILELISGFYPWDWIWKPLYPRD